MAEEYTGPPRQPFEDLDAGLYIHPGSAEVLTIEDKHTDPERADRWVSETRYYVDVQAFMEVQRERDEYRKALAMINAWRIGPDRDEATLERLLKNAGFDDGQAKAVSQLIAWATR